MTDAEVEAFLAVAHAGSVSKAASELYVSQSALSRRLKSLEEELGFQLFIRSKGIRTVELTRAGMAFIQAASKWKNLWGEIQDLGALNNQMMLNISVINSINYCVMPGFFETFLAENPWVYLTIRTVPSLDTFRYVENGIVDLALFSDDNYVPNANMRPAYRENMVLICRKDMEFPEVVSTDQLDVSKHLYMPWNREYEAWYHRWFSQEKVPRVWFNNIQLMEEILISNQYWAIVPASAAKRMGLNSELSIHVIKEEPPERIIYYLLGAHDKGEAVSLFFQYFDTHLKKNYGDCVTPMIDLKEKM